MGSVVVAHTKEKSHFGGSSQNVKRDAHFAGIGTRQECVLSKNQGHSLPPHFDVPEHHEWSKDVTVTHCSGSDQAIFSRWLRRATLRFPMAATVTGCPVLMTHTEIGTRTGTDADVGGNSIRNGPNRIAHLPANVRACAK